MGNDRLLIPSMKILNLLTIGFLIILSPSIFATSFLKKDHLQVRIISSQPELSSIVKYGVHFKIDPEWHIYWKNPGDSGASPKFNFTGGKIQRIQWPYPVRLPLGELTNYGYEHEVVFPLEIVPDSAKRILNLEWLVCKVECVPGFAEFDLSKDFPVEDRALYEKYERLTPAPSTKWNFKFVEKNESSLLFEMFTSPDELVKIDRLFVFPENGANFKTSPPLVEGTSSGLLVSVPVSANANFKTTHESFTFVVHHVDNSVESFTYDLELRTKPVAWLWGLFLAFLGGLILNLMPCVFPVLFLKAFGFLKEPNIAAIRKSSWQYFLGVVLSFLAIGAILTALRLSGEAIGWGFQLQHPWLVYLLALLFFAMALNFFGFFEIGDALVVQTNRFQSNRFFSSSFGTGVLAVIVASPCTAPFMGSAVGLTLILPPHQSLLIFVALGVGMAAPMLLLTYIPRLVEKLPRSGAWMIRVKQFMAFPLIATALWLLWVLGNQKGSEAIFSALVSFLIFTLGLWIMNLSSRWWARILAISFLVAAPATNIYVTEKILVAERKAVAASAWAPYDETVIAERKKTQPVFIDFTASWCITCQFNKKNVLETDEIQSLFKTKNVYLVRADWTNYDPVITKALARHGRNSIPFYLFYNKLGTQTLPEFLTKDLVKNLLEKEN